MTGLAYQLRQASHDLHAVAERTGLMAVMVRGKLAHAHYANWLVNLQAIYAALEAGLRADESASGIDFVPLYRSNAIAQDLQFLQPAPDALLCEATRRYVQRLDELAATQPQLLLAHAYVRYLGDLHGGQMLRRSIANMLRIGEDQGVRFYDFGSSQQVKQLIQSFRAGLDGLALEEDQRQAMAEEARLGFSLHIAMFEQLPH
jgi:heme oxygenase